jgi:hypothetical protein
MSRRNAVLSSAAWTGVSGGDNRVLVRPGCDALAITAMAQRSRTPGRAAGLTTVVVIRAGAAIQMRLKQMPLKP